MVGSEMPGAEGRCRPGVVVSSEVELSLLVSWLLCAHCLPDHRAPSTLHPTAQELLGRPGRTSTVCNKILSTWGQLLAFLKSVGKSDLV